MQNQRGGKMGVPVVGIDLDGVLVDFNKVFLRRLSLLSGREYTVDQVTNYSYAKCLPELDKATLSTAFREIPNTPDFWVVLPHICQEGVDAAKELGEISHLYAVTARVPMHHTWRNVRYTTTLAQSEYWLRSRGIDVMGVIKCKGGLRKGPLVHALGCDYFLEDSPESFLSCREFGVNVFLMDAPYNQDIDTDRRIYSVREYVDMIKESIL